MTMFRQTIGRCGRAVLVALPFALLAACAAIEVPEVAPTAQAGGLQPWPVSGNQPPNIRLNYVDLALPASRQIGGYRFDIECMGPYSNLFVRDLPRSRTSTAWWQDGATGAIRDAGFQVRRDEDQRPTGQLILVGAEINELKVDACRESDFFSLVGSEGGETGQAYIRVQWEAFDPNGQAIFSEEVEATALLADAAKEGWVILAADAFANSMHEFALDLRRHMIAEDVRVTGSFVPSPPTPQPRAPVAVAPLRSSEPAVRAISQPLLKGPVEEHAVALLAATMLVDDGIAPRLAMAMGSLAGQSVVVSHLPADPKIGAPVTLMDSAGQQSLGQVMAVPGDWALVGAMGQAAKMPKGLPVATEAPAIGDMIYAVTGQVDRQGFEPQISRGIISGFCPDAAVDGSALYQVDLAIGRGAMLGTVPGQAGGVLVDASGNLLGLAVAAETGDHDPALSCMRTLTPHGPVQRPGTLATR
ncbi:MAG: trypsin-like peptidase domain-containing protein [Alphaproteobacteria bacterium]|nr:trypsin-like peptidase domain-containing protein [Alphaproteobacteria bacterium SS10]